jgi:hypothetical protein
LFRIGASAAAGCHAADRFTPTKLLAVTLEELGFLPRTAVLEVLVDRLVLFCLGNELPLQVPITSQDVVGVEVMIADNLEDNIVGPNPDDLPLAGDA